MLNLEKLNEVVATQQILIENFDKKEEMFILLVEELNKRLKTLEA